MCFILVGWYTSVVVLAADQEGDVRHEGVVKHGRVPLSHTRLVGLPVGVPGVELSQSRIEL